MHNKFTILQLYALPTLYLKTTDYMMHHQFDIQQLYAVPTMYFLCFVFIWEQTATCATYSINWLVFITEIKSVYSAVRGGSLNKAVCASSLNGYSQLSCRIPLRIGQVQHKCLVGMVCSNSEEFSVYRSVYQTSFYCGPLSECHYFCRSSLQNYINSRTG